MKLTKQNKKLTLLVALVALLVLTTMLGVVAYAAGQQATHDLTLYYETAECTIKYRENEGEWRTILPGVPCQIQDNARVTIKIETNPGYELYRKCNTECYDDGNGRIVHVGIHSCVYEDENYTIPSQVDDGASSTSINFGFNNFTSAKTLYVDCVERVYNITYVSGLDLSVSASKEDYKFLTVTNQGVNAVYKPLKKLYGGSTVLVSPVELAGYIFNGWQVVQVSESDPTQYEIVDTLYGDSLSGYIVRDQIIGPKIHETGTIYLRPILVPKEFEVYRYDHVYSSDVGAGYEGAGELLGTHHWTAYMDDEFYGFLANPDPNNPRQLASQANGVYPGYKVLEGKYTRYEKPGWCRVSEGVQNSLIRYYEPITYKVIFTNYDTMPDGVDADNFTHVFNRDTALPTPSRFGYVFSGWRVTVDGTVVGTVSAEDNLLAASKIEYAAQDEQITLEAIWTPEKYTIVYVDVDMAINQALPTVHEFDTPTAIVGAKRVGYQIVGWYVNGSTTMIPAKDFAIAADQATWDDPLTEDVVERVIRLQAVWEPKQLSVVFDGNGAGDTVYGVDVLYSELGIPNDKIIFDTLLGGVYTKKPSRTGYTFLGYFSEPNGGVQYFDAEGKALDGARWITDSLDDGTVIKLYAHWQVNTYELFLNVDKTLIQSITVNGVEWDKISAIRVDYRQKITIVIKSADGYKVVKFKNQAVAHQAEFTTEYTHLTDGNLTVEIILLEVHAPDFKVDYPNEKLTNHGVLLNGKYTVYLSDDSEWGTIVDGVFRKKDSGESYATIPSDFFGTSIRVVWHGIDNETADSDPVEIVIAARPVLPPDQWFAVHEQDGRIEVSIPDTAIGKYEFSISTNKVLAGDAVWQSANVFTSLANGEEFTPGTVYYVFVRIKATETEPHSTPNGPWGVITHHIDFVAQLKSELNGLRQDGDGDYVQSVIDNAKAAIDELAGRLGGSDPEHFPMNFYEDALAIVENAKNELTLARKRDRAAAKLNEKVGALLNTGAYSTNGEIQLDLILDRAVLDLETAENEEEINRILNKAMSDLAAVKVNSVTATDTSSNSNLQIIAPGGMSSNAKIALVRIADLKLLSGKVSDAIRAGKIVVTQSGVAYDDMLGVLGTQEVVAAFKVIVSNDSANNGEYEIRLLIPDDLRSIQSLHVGYYDDASGELKLFETHIDGDYLVFTADRIADFVIIGDPNVSLIPVIAILGGTLLLQLIAIVYLLIRRKKVAKTVRLYSTALPVMALTIRFLPVYGLPAVILLGALVVIAQIVLIVLLLRSDIIRRHPNDTVAAPASEESVPVLPMQTETEDLSPNTYGDDEVGDEAFYVPNADEPMEEDAELMKTEEEDPFAIYDEEATEDAQDFIEPAITPRYSLPDEEDGVPTFAQEEAQEAFYEGDLEQTADGEDPDGAAYEEAYEEVYEEVDWEEVDENTPIEDADSAALYYEPGENEEIVYEESFAEDISDDEPVLYTPSFEADEAQELLDADGESIVEEIVYEDSEGDEPLEEAEEVLVYEEDPFADIDDSRLADDEVYSEEEIEDIDDSKVQYEE